jgi:hypothetical protein
LTVVIVNGFPAIVVGMHRGIVTPGDGRPPDITEMQAFSGAFFTRALSDGLSFWLPPSSSLPPQAKSPVPNVAKAAKETIPKRTRLERAGRMINSLLLKNSLQL